MADALGLSYRNMQQLNARIDQGIPARPKWFHEEVELEGETLEFHHRDVLECIRALYSDPQFARYLVFRPEQHFTDQTRSTRLYHEMHTSNWWWTVQV